MTQTVEVEIDAVGNIRPVNTDAPLPPGRAILILQPQPEIDCMLLSEPALAEYWLSPEEDEAWAYIQPVR